MKLEFRHSGLQFFFVTLTLEGRPQALSRLVEGEARPALLPAGETVQAFLRAFHAVCPAVTISDRVIMPDHVHFLMIVRYDLAPTFNPLWASFALMRAIEAAWRRTDGGSAPAPPETAASPSPEAAENRKPAPDAAENRKPAPETTENRKPPTPAGETIAPEADASPLAPEAAVALLAEAFAEERRVAAALQRLTAQGLTRAEALLKLKGAPAPIPPQGARGAPPPVRSALRFDRRAYVELSFDSRQLKAIRRYIRLNAARALWKRRHPDRFARVANVRHAILDPSRAWSAMGNLTLLGSPFLVHARLTLKKTVAEHEPAIAELVERARRGAVVVSGFISPGEVELLRRLKAEPRTRFVKMLPCALPPRYDPSAEDSRELAADRLLILSGFANTTPHISALEMRRDPRAAHLFRANCLAMNDLAAALCQSAQERA